MTQKQALQRIIDSLDYEWIKYQFITDWLEDINWHTECAMLRDRTPEHAEQEAVINANRHETLLAYQVQKAKNCVSAFSTIYGWGIDHTEWTSGGSGEAFVNELQEMIKNEAQN